MAKNKHGIEITYTPVKRNVFIYTLTHDAPQGEVDLRKLQDFITECDIFEKRRPSKKEGLWKLSTGDWARRDGARFIKVGDNWQEIQIVNRTDGSDNQVIDASEKMGDKPVTKASKEKVAAPGANVFKEE